MPGNRRVVFAGAARRRARAPAVEEVAGAGTRPEPAGLTVAWSFGDGGLAAGHRREARAQEGRLGPRCWASPSEVVADVSGAYVDLRTAELRVETAQSSSPTPREALRISEGAGGINDFLEVTDAQASLFWQAQPDAGAERRQRGAPAMARALGDRHLSTSSSEATRGPDVVVALRDAWAPSQARHRLQGLWWVLQFVPKGCPGVARGCALRSRA